ncbi:hypothetical protein FIBSPDRAFT_885984 [Athelia psychrophila]|uniref:Uncharacterized protein n=1 Tax=Athelia psychrophila TaxID=1759441 RepID=A0A166RBG9_9AGAM|nr:hypothetical protein FIBSPDRAFT_885984 [Fibularhizoctonia sp. CBS 109695]
MLLWSDVPLVQLWSLYFPKFDTILQPTLCFGGNSASLWYGFGTALVSLWYGSGSSRASVHIWFGFSLVRVSFQLRQLLWKVHVLQQTFYTMVVLWFGSGLAAVRHLLPWADNNLTLNVYGKYIINNTMGGHDMTYCYNFGQYSTSTTADEWVHGAGSMKKLVKAEPEHKLWVAAPQEKAWEWDNMLKVEVYKYLRPGPQCSDTWTSDLDLDAQTWTSMLRPGPRCSDLDLSSDTWTSDLDLDAQTWTSDLDLDVQIPGPQTWTSMFRYLDLRPGPRCSDTWTSDLDLDAQTWTSDLDLDVQIPGPQTWTSMLRPGPQTWTSMFRYLDLRPGPRSSILRPGPQDSDLH